MVEVVKAASARKTKARKAKTAVDKDVGSIFEDERVDAWRETEESCGESSGLKVEKKWKALKRRDWKICLNRNKVMLMLIFLLVRECYIQFLVWR